MRWCRLCGCGCGIAQALIGFVTALEDAKYADAMARLEGLELTPETEAMWMQLQEIALGAGELTIAERCSAALGDVCRSRFLHKTSKVRHQSVRVGVHSGCDLIQRCGFPFSGCISVVSCRCVCPPW